VFVLFKKDRLPFFELVTPTSEETKKFEKTRTRKTHFHIYKFKLAGEW
jgi:hypothetical protein